MVITFKKTEEFRNQKSGFRMESKPAKTFMELIVWQKTHKWVFQIYRYTEKFPKTEMYGLSSQLRWSAVSVPANIAEGFKKWGIRDKKRYFNIAQGSLEESRYYQILTKDLGYGDSSKLMDQLEEVSRLLDSNIKSIGQKNSWFLIPDF